MPKPDKAWSKAINAGQYPLLVGMTKKSAELYVTGIYGNTMTTNPRSNRSRGTESYPELRQNIRERGKELKNVLEKLMGDFPESILSVEGTGLLVCRTHP